VFVVLIKKEDINSRFNLIEDCNSKRYLNFIARISKLNIIINLEDFIKLNLFMLLKIILRYFYFYNKSFFDQCVSSLLRKLASLKLFNFILKNQYLVQLVSIFFDVKIVNNSSKSSEELFLKRIYRINNRLFLIID